MSRDIRSTQQFICKCGNLWAKYASDACAIAWTAAVVLRKSCLQQASNQEKGTNPSLLGSAALRVSVSIVKLRRSPEGNSGIV
ncbi:hypothetical protein Q8A67_006797 [Cirrhinus molitorella]|uniref:Uncharacterized protein n=1 Tax=Cirrhinus molitorella TaxID=172907 RepID=A0AA88PXZ4_9TELE|nr:hypothetical protein Q8A67_006797 [Cirrhinus molitorella]